MNLAARIQAARCRYLDVCKCLRIAREQAAESPTAGRAATVAIFEARADLAAAYCARVESASVGA